MSNLNFSSIESEIGKIFIIANSRGVSKVIFGEKGFKNFLDSVNSSRVIEGGAAEELAAELSLYLEGRLSSFKTDVDLSSGTRFQKAVWKKLLEVPYGEVITYKDLARAVGSPKGARAVGNAVGANPVPIVIPCHRVLASNGLGGYSCGVEIKKDLLRLEGALT
jgi:O-6-methylguanine DNA methyltransferase